MSQSESTTITLHPDTRDALWSRKQGPEDTYERVVRRLLERVPNDE